jgi:hypothetical protein
MRGAPGPGTCARGRAHARDIRVAAAPPVGMHGCAPSACRAPVRTRARYADTRPRARTCRQWLEGASTEKRVRPSPAPEVKPEPPAQPSAERSVKVDDDEGGADEDGEEQSYFAVNLFVAALGDGKLIAEGARKRKDLLEQVVRNVSKEQNTVVYVPKDGTTMHLKMRVFVENSIEAKAVIDYIASQPSQACPCARCRRVPAAPSRPSAVAAAISAARAPRARCPGA